MSKAQETKERILKHAAELFNQQGYAGASMSDLMQATGLQKGGIYNHFESKQALALKAFDFAFQQSSERLLKAVKAQQSSIDRLQAILLVFGQSVENPPIAGGCPLLNTAIESDDANPVLRDRVQLAMNSWRDLICRIINKGMRKGEIQPTANPDEIATIMISTLEGAMMLSKLYGDSIHMERAINHLSSYISQFQTS